MTSELREHTFKIRASVDEKLAIESRKPVGFALAEWWRQLALGQDVKEKRKRRSPPKVDPELLRQLARMGGNLNQIARALNVANRKGNVVDVIELKVLLCSMERELTALRISHKRS